MATLQDVQDIILAGKAKLTPGVVQEALDSGIDPKEILNTMIDTMGIVGERFTRNEIFVPEMLVAAKAMKKGVAVLKPYLAEGVTGAMGKMVIGTVSGDLHDIGKNLVAMMIESAGFEVIDLGVDVPAEVFVETVRENPDTRLVGLSALLTTTMPAMEEIVAELNKQEFRPNIKIMVGGAPITQEFADRIGADCYTEDAATAAVMAKQLVSMSV